jgi:hypothetical protein
MKTERESREKKHLSPLRLVGHAFVMIGEAFIFAFDSESIN